MRTATYERATTPLLLLAALGLSALAGCTGLLGSPAGSGAGADGGVDGGAGSHPAAGSPCPPTVELFVADLWQPTLSVTCVNCHHEGGLAGGSRMVLDRAGDAAAEQKNFETVMRVAAVKEAGESILLLRPTGRHPDGHPGGTLFLPGSVEHARFARFVGRVVGDPSACDGAAGGGGALLDCRAGAAPPGRRQLRRLSHAEYETTLVELFGREALGGATPSTQLAADVVVNGFSNDAAQLTVSPLLADQYRQTAEAVATAVTGDAARLERVAPCPGGQAGGATGGAAVGAACLDAFLDGAAGRLYRRPLSSDERQRLARIYEVGQEGSEPGGHAGGMELVLSAMLQAPSFLYRPELGERGADGTYALSGSELASALSYLLWGGPPDEALLTAAADGSLARPAVLEEQARRLLADPRSKVVLERFALQWLDVERLASVPKDEMIYPGFDPGVRAALQAQVAAHLQAVTAAGASFAELLQGALPALDGAAAVVGDGERLGLLESAAVLATHARPNSSSPVHRGKLVRERLLCQPLPPPPPGLVVQPPALDPGLTTRERYRRHSEEGACQSCHRLMDPIGFSFEAFDGIGQRRGAENGLEVDDAGEILGSASTDGTFKGTRELAALLAGSDESRACFARQWVRFGWGTGDRADVACAQKAIEEAYLAGDGRIDGLLLALVRAPHFRLRSDEAAMLPGGGSGGGPDGGPGGGAPDGGAGPDAAAPGADAAAPDGGSPPAVAGVSTEQVVDSDWGQGYCARVTVTSTAAEPVTWQVDLEVGGTLASAWNAVAEAGAPAGRQRFRGETWNATLAPGASTELGYCANR